MFRNSVPAFTTRLSAVFLILSVLLSHDLFMGQSLFTPFRVFDAFSLVGPSLGVVGAIMLLLLLATVVKPHFLVLKIAALACYTLLCIDDLNRFQVEFVAYFLILFVPTQAKREGAISLLIFTAMIYFGAGVSKFNQDFKDLVSLWFFEPVFEIAIGDTLYSLLGTLIPASLVCLSILLLINKPTRTLAATILILFHAVIIFMLFIVHNSYYGLGVFNAFCIILLFSLFYLRTEDQNQLDYNYLVPVFTAGVLFIASTIAVIHPYFSFQVFSKIPVKATLMVSDAYFNRIPEYLQAGSGDFNGERYIDLTLMYTTNTSFPPYPKEENYFKNITLFSELATSSEDLVLIVKRGDTGGLGNGFYGYSLKEMKSGELTND